MSYTQVALRLVATLIATLLLLPLPAAADEDGHESGEVENLPFSELSFSEPEKHFSATQGCVAPEDEMRRNHMEYILHQRDETMYDGIRTRKYSLEECVNCHAVKDQASGEFIPVNDPNQFCSSCHSYTSVKLDCFECHATRPARASELQHTRSFDNHRGSFAETSANIHAQPLLAAEDEAQ